MPEINHFSQEKQEPSTSRSFGRGFEQLSQKPLLPDRSSSLLLRTIKVIEIVSTFILVISLVALAAMAILSYQPQIIAIPLHAYYLPAAGVGTAIGLAIIAKILNLFVGRQKLKPEDGEIPDLHPKVKGAALPFIEQNLKKIDGEKEAISTFLLVMSDFLGLNAEGYPKNAQLSLSFLLSHFYSLKEEKLVNDKKLTALIRQLEISYQFESYRSQLEKASSLEDYQLGRQYLCFWIIETLKKEGSLILDGGYVGGDSGHAVVLHLTLKNGLIKGTFINTGEGSQYHPHEVSEKEKNHALTLEPVAIADLERSHFLEMLIDLQMPDLITTDSVIQTESRTSYSIEDVYQSLLPAWPGKIKSDPEFSYSPQYSGSCLMSPYLRWMKKELGETDFSNVKVYLGLKTCESLLQHTSPESLDEQRIHDTLAKFNRFVLSMERKKLLRSGLKKEVLKVTSELKKEVKKARTQSHQTLPLGGSRDRGSYDIKFPPISSINRSWWREREKMTLPTFDYTQLTAYLTQMGKKAVNELKRGHSQEAKKIAHEAIFQIPNPSDPIWSSKRPEEEMGQLYNLIKALFEEKTRVDKKSVSVTPNEAVLYLKTLTIALGQAYRVGMPEDVIALYKEKLQTALKQTGHLYTFTLPTYAKTYFDCLKVIGELKGQEREILLKKQYSCSSSWWNLEENEYKSLKQLRKDPELHFLNEYLQLHPEVYEKLNKRKTEKKDKKRAEETKELEAIRITLKLYQDRNSLFQFYYPFPDYSSFIPKIFKAKIHDESLRHWIFLRNFHTMFLFSSFFSGNVNNDSFHLFYTFRNGRYTKYSKDANIGGYTLKDFKEQQRGLFFDTFTSFPENVGQELCKLVDVNSPFAEKARVTQNEHLLFQEGQRYEEDFNLSSSDIQSLLSIRAEDSLAMSQLIEFFSRHFYSLKDTRFQALFSQFFFSLSKNKTRLVLQDVIEAPSLIKNQLLDFLKASLSKTEKLGWLETHLFILRTLAQFASYLSESSQDELLEEVFHLLQTNMHALLTNEKFSSEEKGKVVAAIISLAPYLKNGEVTPKLLPFCQKAKAEWQQKGYLISLSDHLQWQEDYEIGDLMLENVGEAKGVLPQKIVSHNDYIFERNYRAVEIGYGQYEFQDERQTKFHIALEGNSLRTFRQIREKWFEFVKEPLSQFGRFHDKDHPCLNGYFVDDTHIWKSNHEALVYSHATDELLGVIKNGDIFHPKETTLRLATDYNAKFISNFERIAPKQNILVWKDSHERVVLTEIPSRNLSFEFVDQKWKSKNYPGYFLDADLSSPDLKQFSHYLVLRNQKGNRVAIMPNYGIKPKKQNALEAAEIDSGPITKNVDLLTYQLDQKGKIKQVDNSTHTVYLIYLALRKFDFKLAQKWVDQLKKERSDFDKQGCFWIQELDLQPNEVENFLDMQPKAVSIRLQLRLLQKELSSVPFEKKQIEGLKKDYFRYLQLRKHTFGCPLSPKEELKCLKILFSELSLSETEKYRAVLRQHVLTDKPLPDQLNITEAFPEAKSPRVELTFKWLDQNIEKLMWDSIDDPKPIALYTRPGSAMVQNFLYYYSIVKELPQEHPLSQQLIQFLESMQFTDDVKISSLRILLLNVFERPADFPAIEDLEKEYLKEEDPDNKKIKKKTLQETLEVLKNGLRNVSLNIHSFNSAYDQNQLTHHGVAKSVTFEPTSPRMSMPISPRKGEWEPLPIESFLKKQDWELCAHEIREDLSLLEDMEDYFTNLQNDDPCVQRENKRIVDGVKIKKKILEDELRAQMPGYLLDERKIGELKGYLRDRHKDLNKKLQGKKQEILKIVHHYPGSLHLEKEGEMLRPLSLNELLIHFGTGEDKLILASNPSIDNASLRVLKQHLHDYLILATDLQHTLSLNHSLEKIEEHFSKNEIFEAKVLEKSFINQALAKRVYDPSKESHLLAFEYFGKVRLRQDQYDALNAMVGTEDDIELEARTGFGKSKVLIPLWLYLKSRKDKVAMMTVPSSLFNAQLKYLREVLGKSFDSLIVPIQFDRSKANDPKFLKRLNRKLEDARANHKIVLTTVQALHGLANLKFKETLAGGKGKEDRKLQANLVQLRGVIAEKLADFFDESKVCFDPRHRHDYAMGSLSDVDKEKAETAYSVYQTLFFESDLADVYAFEFLGKCSRKAPLIQEDYEKELLPKLAQKMMQYLVIPREFQAVISHDLQGHYTKECERYYKTLSKEKLDEYSGIKKLLTVHLRRSLYRKFKDGYGFYPGTRLAIPYVDGIAKIGSEFSELEDYINFTIQANLKTPFKVSEITTFFDQLKVKTLELTPLEINELPEMKWLRTFINQSLNEIAESHYPQITEYLNNHPEVKLGFIHFAVISQIKIYHQKVTSTSFNLISALSHIQAASGTVNPDMLPPRMKTIENKAAVVDNLTALWKNQKNVSLLCEGSPEKQLQDLLEGHLDASVLIDVAGTFRELEPETTAQLILEKKVRAKGVLLYDDQGREMIYEKNTQRLISRDESLLETKDLFIFIRKSKAVGTDTPMMLSAKAIVTIDRDSNRDFVLQGTGRMRKLTEGQTVQYALTEEDAQIMFERKELLFKHLIAHTAKVQGKQKGEDGSYILRLYLEDLIEQAFWKAARKSSLKELPNLFKELEQFLIKNTQTSAIDSLRQEQSKLPAKDAVRILKMTLLKPVEKFCRENPKWKSYFDLKEIEKQFDQFVDYDKLPKEISMNSGGDEISTVEAEAMEEVEDIVDQITELDSENVSDKFMDLPGVRFKPAVPLQWDGDYQSLLVDEPDRHLLGVDIYYSPNFNRVSKDPQENKKVQKPAYQYLVQKSKEGDLKILLLDLHDAAIVLKKMENRLPRDEEMDEYYLYSGSHLIAMDSERQSYYSSDKDWEHLSVSLITKLYSADVRLTKSELKYLIKVGPSHTEQFLDRASKLQKVWPHLDPFIAKCKQKLNVQVLADGKGKKVVS